MGAWMYGFMDVYTQHVRMDVCVCILVCECIKYEQSLYVELCMHVCIHVCMRGYACMHAIDVRPMCAVCMYACTTWMSVCPSP